MLMKQLRKQYMVGVLREDFLILNTYSRFAKSFYKR